MYTMDHCIGTSAFCGLLFPPSHRLKHNANLGIQRWKPNDVMTEMVLPAWMALWNKVIYQAYIDHCHITSIGLWRTKFLSYLICNFGLLIITISFNLPNKMFQEFYIQVNCCLLIKAKDIPRYLRTK